MPDSVASDQLTPKAAKDKNCPYCGQAFTSSSLGRHLDLYIKDKNPKPPDGIHDVDEIRKSRGNITRRQPRGLHISKIDISTGLPLTTPGAGSPSEAGSGAGTPNTQHDPKDNRSATRSATAGLALNAPRWEVTGVINDIPPTPKVTESPAQDASRRAIPQQRQVSRQVAKAQFDMKQRVQDALDTARASELALREVLGSWRAAKSLFDLKSIPFEFDPLAMDFPALTLQCLQPPPTLFSQTQLPSQSSWSITPPGSRQYEALRTFFLEAFQKWRISCASVTTAVLEDMPYPPAQESRPVDIPDMVRMAERTAETSEKQVSEHLDSAFGVWDALSPQRQHELWVVELARSVGKRQEQMKTLQDEKHTLRQENANLKSQIEHLNRLQQPREFKIFPPSTIPMSENLVSFMQEQGTVHGRSITALNRNDRHSDLNTVVQSALDRWKHVIVSARTASGMNAQRPFDQALSPHPSSTSIAPGGSMTPATPSGPPTSAPARPSVPILQHPPQPRHQVTATPVQSGAAYAQSAAEHTKTSVATSSAPPLHPSSTSVTTVPDAWASSAATSSMTSMDDDEMSDQDADAEMEDDIDFSQHTPHTAAPPAFVKQQPPPTPPPPTQQAPQLQVPRTRRPASQQQNQLGMNGTINMTQQAMGSPVAKFAPGMPVMSSGGMGRGRSATSVHPGLQRQTRNFTAQAQTQQQHQQQHQPQHQHQVQHPLQNQHQQIQNQNQHQQADWSMGMHGLSGDQMHME